VRLVSPELQQRCWGEEFRMRLPRFTHVINRLVAVAVLGGLVSLPMAVTAAHADDPTTPVVHPTLFATAPPNTSKPDDITLLDGRLYVTYQNNAGTDGNPPPRPRGADSRFSRPRVGSARPPTDDPDPARGRPIPRPGPDGPSASSLFGETLSSDYSGASPAASLI
jgi:hypothetical protein